jgi:hypothetical protein
MPTPPTTNPITPVKPIDSAPGLQAPRGTYVRPKAPELRLTNVNNKTPLPPPTPVQQPQQSAQQPLNVQGNPGWRLDIPSIAAQYATSPVQKADILGRNAVLRPKSGSASDHKLDQMISVLNQLSVRSSYPNPPTGLLEAIRAHS